MSETNFLNNENTEKINLGWAPVDAQCLRTHPTHPHPTQINDMSTLKQHKDSERKLIITDGVFSMDGDIAPLNQITELAEEHDAMVFVDDCHGEGVLGEMAARCGARAARCATHEARCGPGTHEAR